jgi:hypothetical protein
MIYTKKMPQKCPAGQVRSRETGRCRKRRSRSRSRKACVRSRETGRCRKKRKSSKLPSLQKRSQKTYSYLKNVKSQDPDEFIDRFDDKFWNQLYTTSTPKALKLYEELITAITNPLQSEFYSVNWEIRDNLIKEAANVIKIRIADRLAFLRIYLNVFFNGSRYMEKPNQELKSIKKYLNEINLSTLFDWFFDEINIPLQYATTVDGWVEANEDIFVNSQALGYLLPYVKMNITPIPLDDFGEMTNTKLDKYRQFYVILQNRDNIDY